MISPDPHVSGRPAGLSFARRPICAAEKPFDVRQIEQWLNEVFDRLRGRGALSEDDVAAASREIRIALLEADVALPVVRDFVNAVRERAIGQEVLRSVTPDRLSSRSCTTISSRCSAAGLSPRAAALELMGASI